MLNFLKLIRFPNLIILVLSLVLMQYFLVVPFMISYQLQHTIDPIMFWCVTFSAVLMMAGGFVINDYYDFETDAINKPHKMIIGSSLSKEKALNFYILLTISGILIGLYGGWRIKYFGMMSITPLPAILLWFYATTFKRKLFIGNFIVAFLCGGILVLPLLFNIYTFKAEGLPLIVSAYAGFAFMLTLIREIIKDLEDVEGDRNAGCNTLPIAAGIMFSKTVVIVLSLIVLAFIGWFQWLQFQSETFYETDYISFSYIMLFIQLPLLILIYMTAKANDKTDFHHASTVSKLIMVTGLLSVILFWYLLIRQN